jgi:hypothetical protein
MNAMSMNGSSSFTPTPAEIDEESRRIRRLRIVVNLSLSLIAEGDLPFSEAQKLAAAARQLAENLFPGKSEVYDLVYGTKFRRLIFEMYRLQ